LTIEAWIKRTRTDVATAGPSGSGAIFGYGWNGYAFGLYNDGRLLMSKVGSSGVNSRAAVNDINWHHVAVTKTGGLVAFYLDGVSDGQQAYDPGFAFTSNAAIGAAGETGSDFLGSIDELSVYSRGLTEAEIVALVGAGSLGKCTNFPPVIFDPPQSQNIAVGSNVVFHVRASSAALLSYQWNFNDNPISGATNEMLVVSNVLAAAAGNYTVTVSNTFGSVPSNPATLIVSAGPKITKQPRSQTVLVGGNAAFTVTASGTPPLSYEWQFNSRPISGATGPILIVNSVQIADAGSYSVLVTNSVQSVLSDFATLTVASGTLSLAPVSEAIQLDVTGEAGASYTVEVSPDLVNWSSLVSEVNVPVSWQFIDPTTGGVNQRFYRLRKK